MALKNNDRITSSKLDTILTYVINKIKTWVGTNYATKSEIPTGLVKTNGDQTIYGIKTFATTAEVKASSGTSSLRSIKSNSSDFITLSYRTDGQRGVYDSSINTYVIDIDSSGNVVFRGTANKTVTTASTIYDSASSFVDISSKLLVVGFVSVYNTNSKGYAELKLSTYGAAYNPRHIAFPNGGQLKITNNYGSTRYLKCDDGSHNLSAGSSYTMDISKGVVVTISGDGGSAYFIYSGSNVAYKMSKGYGNSTTPIYIDSNGVPQTCSSSSISVDQAKTAEHLIDLSNGNAKDNLQWYGDDVESVTTDGGNSISSTRWLAAWHLNEDGSNGATINCVQASNVTVGTAENALKIGGATFHTPSGVTDIYFL